MSLESLEKELLEREKIFELKQKEFKLKEQELQFKEKEQELQFKEKEQELQLKEQEIIYKEKLNELEKREQSFNIGQKFSKNKENDNSKNKKIDNQGMLLPLKELEYYETYNENQEMLLHIEYSKTHRQNKNSILNRIEKEKNEKEEKQKKLINRELNKHRIYMDTIEEDREKELKKILIDFRKKMPKLEGLYTDNSNNQYHTNAIKTSKIQLELSLETIQLLNNTDIDILFNSYKSLIESCIHFEKYYKVDNNHRNFIDFVFDNFIDSEKGFNNNIYNSGYLNNQLHSLPYTTRDYRLLKLIIENKREYYYVNFNQNIFDYNNNIKPIPDKSFFNIGSKSIQEIKQNKYSIAWDGFYPSLRYIFTIWFSQYKFIALDNFYREYKLNTIVKNRNNTKTKGFLPVYGNYNGDIYLIPSLINKICGGYVDSTRLRDIYLDGSHNFNYLDTDIMLDEEFNNINEVLQLQYIFIELIETIRPEIIQMYTDKLF